MDKMKKTITLFNRLAHSHNCVYSRSINLHKLFTIMENLTFESKCRKCNTINVSESPKLDSYGFQCLMNIYLRSAPLLPCPKCGIFTIQDICSHTRVISGFENELTKSQTDLIERCK